MKLRKLLERTYYGTKVKIVSGVEDRVKVLVDDYTLECGKQNVPIMYADNKVEAIRIDGNGNLVIYVEDDRTSAPHSVSNPLWAEKMAFDIVQRKFDEIFRQEQKQETPEYKSTECCQVTHSPGKDEL